MKLAGSRLLAAAALLAVSLGAASGALYGLCGPFTDVADDAFCPFVREIFCLAITTGTTATTFDPTNHVTRLQMAAFLSRTVDRVLQRASPRTVHQQFWTPQNGQAAGMITYSGAIVGFAESDGADLWVTGNNFFNTGFVFRTRASDGKLLGTWTSTITASPQAPLLALGKVFAPGFGNNNPSRLYRIDPLAPPGAATIVATNLGPGAQGIAFDGSKIWTANGDGTVSRIDPSGSIPLSVSNTGSFQSLLGILYDGANMWVTDFGAGKLLKLNDTGGLLQTVTVGTQPGFAAFDGANVWVPNTGSNSVSIVRVSNGAVLATLTGNGLSGPKGAIFDGQRLLITNNSSGTVSLWKAADLTSIAEIAIGGTSIPYWGGSDGVHIWVCNFAGLMRF